MTWTDGYISDVRYPAFFYKEMQPLWLATVAALQGAAAPRADGPFALCELGCGVGVNLLVAAACHPGARFVGVDFNAEHVALARDAAAASGIGNVAFVHTDFAAFAQGGAGGDGGQFDFMTCHGVWSWIAPEQRAALLDGVARRLAPQGLFYLHYMCHPGSAEVLPLQHLLNLCAHRMPGPSPRKAQTGMMLLQQIAAAGGFADRPGMLRHLSNMARRNPADLAHEFLTDHWQPQHSVDVHEEVAGKGLALLGSADVFANLDPALSIPGKLQELVRRTAVPELAEAIKDMARNAHQRMDLFQKEPEGLAQAAWAERLGMMVFRLLPGAPERGPVEFSTPIGPITGPEAIYTPLLRRLSAGPASVAELAALPVFGGDPGGLLQALQLLMMQGIAHPAIPAGKSAAERAGALARWFEGNGLALTVIPECATAAPALPAAAAG